MSFLKIEDENGKRTIYLNRPELHNAFNGEMIAELTKAFREVGNAQLIVLRGEGKSFCAGADLNWMRSMVEYSVEENRQDSLELYDMFAAIRECKIPVLGFVHGNVFGGGLGLTAACDFAAAVSGTKFCFSEVKLGLVPAVISPFVMQKVNEGKAREWMLSGRIFLADEAEEGGLLNFVGSEAEVEEYLNAAIESILSSGPEGVSETKALLNKLKTLNWPERRNETTSVIANKRVGQEAQERMRSFLEKKAKK